MSYFIEILTNYFVLGLNLVFNWGCFLNFSYSELQNRLLRLSGCATFYRTFWASILSSFYYFSFLVSLLLLLFLLSTLGCILRNFNFTFYFFHFDNLFLSNVDIWRQNNKFLTILILDFCLRGQSNGLIKIRFRVFQVNLDSLLRSSHIYGRCHRFI